MPPEDTAKRGKKRTVPGPQRPPWKGPHLGPQRPPWNYEAEKGTDRKLLNSTVNVSSSCEIWSESFRLATSCSYKERLKLNYTSNERCISNGRCISLSPATVADRQLFCSRTLATPAQQIASIHKHRTILQAQKRLLQAPEQTRGDGPRELNRGKPAYMYARYRDALNA